MSKLQKAVGCLSIWALSLVSGCSNNNNAGVSFAFDRPEHVELACMDLSRGSANASPLPMRCCARTKAEEPLATPEFVQSCRPDALPVLHALVTQNVRGEVAAVDLEARRVLDSDRQIPGFTFVDVGGLPTAVVVPLERPTPGFDPVDPKNPAGPPWTYITNVDEEGVRAVATCHFRTGSACGPEKNVESTELRLPLGGVPRDMLLGPDEALWISLPELGVLARVQVGAEAAQEAEADAGTEADAENPSDENKLAEFDKPFLMDGEALATPQYFRVPVDKVAGLSPLDSEDPTYIAACGLGYAYAARPTELPLSDVVTYIEGSAQPARMRYDAVSGLLFVSDRALPLLHVFSLGSDGSLVTRGALSVGAPLRDFAFTGYVPETVDIFSSAPISSEATDQKRYLYGLDDRDGSLMQFALTTSPEGASVTRLEPPLRSRFRDRSLVYGVGSVLEVVDTRGLSPDTCGAGVEPRNPKDTVARELEILKDNFKTPIAKAQTELAKAREELAAATEEEYKEAAAKVSARRTELDAVVADRNKAQRRYEIARDAGPYQLRGVFLMVVSLAGEVSVLDVLDLDVACRARTSCVPGANDENPLRTGSNLLTRSTPVPLAVQRNAMRLLVAGEPSAAVSATGAFASIDCSSAVLDDGTDWVPYVGADESFRDPTILCVPPDPWNQQDNQWSIEQDRALPGTLLTSATLARVDADSLTVDEAGADGGVAEDDADDLAPLDQMLWLHAPQGINLCARGAQDDVGDQVLVLGAPASNPSTCNTPLEGNQPALKIVRAYQDRLLVRALGRTEGSQIVDELPARAERNANSAYAQRAREEVNKLLDCYPRFVSVQSRVGDVRVMDGIPVASDELANEVRKQYLVLGSNAGFLHRMTTADDTGRCVLDSDKDVRLRARVSAGQAFQNTSIGFALAPDLLRTQISIGATGGRTFLWTSIVPPRDYPDALPKSIRYFPMTNNLFVVDSANQGLRRLLLDPFQLDGAAVYR